MAANRNEWQYVEGVFAGTSRYISGGLAWMITNSEEDAKANNRTELIVRMYLSRSSTSATTYSNTGRASWYRHTVGDSAAVQTSATTFFNLGNATVDVKYLLQSNSAASNVFYKGAGTSADVFTIQHNADGTPPSVLLETFHNAAVSSQSFTSVTTSADIASELPVIPRGSIRLNVGGTFKQATPYVNVAGVWKPAEAYIKVNGVWRRGE